MTSSDPLRAATELLREAVADPGDVDALPAGRDAAIARIAEALRARAEARRRRRVFTTLALAAGVTLAVGGGAFAVMRSDAQHVAHSAAEATRDGRSLGRLVEPAGGVTAVLDGHSEPVGMGDRLPEGLELRTAAAEAGLAFDTGTHVTIGSSSRVRLVEQSQHKRFSLESGTLFAKVAKLGPAERFVVTTSDAEVEVRGTAFRVTIVTGDPACAGGTPTRLEVSEGVVVVRRAGGEVRVAAGERWPTCDRLGAVTPPVVTPPVVTPPVVTQADPSLASTVAKPSPAPALAPESSSRLAEQNDLFDEAMRRKQRGDASGAVARLDRLLAQYPSGPLAESAAVERMRLLAATDRGRAAAAARDYLRRHPRGYARAEAEAIRAAEP